MRIGIIIPDRNDRPEFTKNCFRLLKNQTLQPVQIFHSAAPPLSDYIDITKRYKIGYEALRNKDLDFIALIENDDWYSKDYLEKMAQYWIREGKPNILGLDHTIYYNIRIFAHFTMFHSQRSSAMNTILKPDMNFDWGPDENAYADAFIWNILRGSIVVPEKEICIGIKHGVGKCGGQNHTNHLSRFVNADHKKDFLRSLIDTESFLFYSNYFDKNA